MPNIISSLCKLMSIDVMCGRNVISNEATMQNIGRLIATVKLEMTMRLITRVEFQKVTRLTWQVIRRLLL